MAFQVKRETVIVLGFVHILADARGVGLVCYESEGLHILRWEADELQQMGAGHGDGGVGHYLGLTSGQQKHAEILDPSGHVYGSHTLPSSRVQCCQDGADHGP